MSQLEKEENESKLQEMFLTIKKNEALIENLKSSKMSATAAYLLTLVGGILSARKAMALLSDTDHFSKSLIKLDALQKEFNDLVSGISEKTS